MNSHRIYLDHAATSPVRPEVADAMREAGADGDFNPSSVHAEGRRTRAILDAARERVAGLLGAVRSEITFTAGGTEANNEALFGVAGSAPSRSRLVSTVIEHHSILAPLERLRDEGLNVSLLPVDLDGLLEPERFARELETPTALASVGYANNVIGTVQPIAQLSAIARSRGVLFHTDAIQAPSWLPVDVRELGVDLLTLAAHKFGGPKGVGVLFVRRGTPFTPLLLGGGQEFGRRSGTENVTAIAGAARALELAAAERIESNRRIAELRGRLEAGIRSTVSTVRFNGANASRLPNLLSVSFAGAESAATLMALDLAGVAVSAGSACTSGSLEPSHVLAATAAGEAWHREAIRFSLGPRTSQAEIDRVIGVLPRIIEGVRGSMVGR